MTTPTLKIKVTPKPIIKGKMDVRFPAKVDALSPILLDKTGGNYTFGLDMDAVTEAVGNSYQPLDSDLTDIAALTTTSYGRAFLALADAAAARTKIYAAPFDALAYNGMQINGSMDVSQENATAVVSIAAGAVSKYAVDGWQIIKSGTNAFNVQQAASVFPGFDNELKLTVTTAQASLSSDTINLQNCIEGYRFAKARWGTASAVPVTVGFWVKSSVAGTLFATINNADYSAGPLVSATIAAASTAQFITLTFPAQTTGTWNKTNGIGARISLTLANSSAGHINLVATVGNTFEITGFIVLPGVEVPSSDGVQRIMRPFDQELLLCQRYFCSDFPTGTAPANNVQQLAYPGISIYATAWRSTRILFPVRMRAAPTVTPLSSNIKTTPTAGQWQYLDSGVVWQDATDTTAGPAPDGFFMVGSSTMTANGGWFIAGSWKADARL